MALATKAPEVLGPWRPRLRTLTHPLGWYLATRLAILLVATIAVAVHSELSANRLVSAWDARYYLSLLKDGYPDFVPLIDGRAAKSPLAFFPLFPIAARFVVWLFHVPNAAAALVVSLAFGAIAVVLVTELARRLTDDRTARRTTVLFCLFPGSAVFSIGYSESLMIALAAGCLLALLRERWLLAGVAAALATATRPNALALVLACGWASAAAIHHRRAWRSLIAPLLAPAGTAAFLAYLRWHTGEAGVWFRVQREAWQQSFDFGVNTGKVLFNFILDPLGDSRRLEDMVLLGLTVLFCAVFLSMRWPAPVTLYTLAVAGMAACSTIDIVRPRAILTAFPLFVGLAGFSSRREYLALVGAFAVGLVMIVLFPLWASP